MCCTLTAMIEMGVIERINATADRLNHMQITPKIIILSLKLKQNFSFHLLKTPENSPIPTLSPQPRSTPPESSKTRDL